MLLRNEKSSIYISKLLMFIDVPQIGLS